MNGDLGSARQKSIIIIFLLLFYFYVFFRQFTIIINESLRKFTVRYKSCWFLCEFIIFVLKNRFLFETFFDIYFFYLKD